MKNTQPQLKIEQPCPMTLGRIKNGDHFYCKSCNNTIVDFRDKSMDEIVQSLSKQSTCGIFNDDQIVKPSFSFTTTLLFKFLTFLAVSGFNVKPLSAQTTSQTTRDTISIKKQNPHPNTNTGQHINADSPAPLAPAKKKWWRKKKKKYGTIGCPSF